MAPSPQLIVPNTLDMDENNQSFLNALHEHTRNNMECTGMAVTGCKIANLPFLLFLALGPLIVLYIIYKMEAQIRSLVRDLKKMEDHAGISIKTLRKKEAEYDNARNNWEKFEASDEKIGSYMDAENNGDETHGTHDIEKN